MAFLVRQMRRALIAVISTTLLFGPCAAAEERFPGVEWEHLPQAQDGWSEAGLAAAQELSRLIGSSTVMVIHYGAIVTEWGDPAKRTELYSVRKNLLSALIDIAVAQGKMSVESTLAQLAIDDNAPSPTDLEKQATVRMLLKARSGVYHAALYETPEMAAQRPARGSHSPGTFWYYNNWNFNALGTIYENTAGMGIYDALDALIAKPTGMQDYRPADGTYVTGAASIHGAYTIRMSARDLARFALLYLHNGAWAGRQVVPADSDAGRGRGYGYLWWTARPPESALPEGSFFALGNGGQVAFVIPADDLVVVHWVEKLPGVGFRQAARLLDLVLRAGGFDAGP